ncbi:MAG: UdgX family uracil-DNA binding protein [Pseudomonadota bacterium]
MSFHVTIPAIGSFAAWRDAARGLLADNVPPEEVDWQFEGDPAPLFPGDPPPQTTRPLKVSRDFVNLASSAVWHADPQRFSRLYALLCRLAHEPRLMSDPSDPALAKLRGMAKNVHRCQHKMKAFVRFRDLDASGPRRRFVAWFEPTHHTVEPTAPFFAKRFADMDWCIVTPGKTATFVDGHTTFGPGGPRPDLPEDATEEMWQTYYENIFNPARVMISAMTSEMPRKYWKNMPETRAIPELIRKAEARARGMAEAAPTLPPVFASRVATQLEAHQSRWSGPTEDLPAAIAACTRCPLHCAATQAVPGEGPVDARIMIVGEQPGDQEDLQGRPFVGPAGQVLNRALTAAGIDRSTAYLTNAVKHFRFTPKGRRRIHQRPDQSHIDHCKWWLDAERAAVQPALIVALGATAAQALTGTSKALTRRRGQIEQTPDGTPVLITIHPSYLLRLPDGEERSRMIRAFEADLALAWTHISQNA